VENPQDQKKLKFYLLILKKFDNVIDYKNIKLLKAFNEIWKIRPRRKTRIIQNSTL
jgi:ribosomal protein S18